MTAPMQRTPCARRSRTIGALLSLLLAGGLLCSGVRVSRAADETQVPDRSSRAAGSGTRAASRTQAADASRSSRSSDTSREARIEAKLDQILANQDQMMAKLDQILEEVKIVKIRATVR